MSTILGEAIIKAALHYLHSDLPWSDPNAMRCGNGQHMATNDLRDGGLILEKPEVTGLAGAEMRYAPTPGLKLYVDALMAIQFPKQWAIK